MSLFFFNDTATTEIYTLSLHDALPISGLPGRAAARAGPAAEATPDPAVLGHLSRCRAIAGHGPAARSRSEEHTSELQSHLNLVCRLLLEKKQTAYLIQAI